MNLKKFEKTQYPNIYKNRENGTYAVDISLGRDFVSGKRLRTTRTGILTEREAKKILNDIELQKNMKNILTNDKTFKEIYDLYLLDCKITMKQTTIASKIKTYNKYLTMFEHIKITKLDIDCVKKLYDVLIEKKDINNTTRNKTIKQLSSFLNWCVKSKIIYENPCKYITNFSPENTKFKIWNYDTFNKFIIELNKDHCHKSILIETISSLAFWGGFRIGEILALTPSNLNFKDNYVDIQNTAYYDGEWHITNAKTKESENIVFMNPDIMNLVKKYISYLKNNFDLILKEDDFIFINPHRGTIYTDRTIKKHFDYYCEMFKIEQIRIHDLRHSHAAELLSRGYELFDVKERLRHKKISTTADTYGHLNNKRKRQIAEMMTLN